MKRLVKLCVTTIPILALASPVTAAESDGKRPAKRQASATHSHRGPKRLMLENAEGATITLWKPDLTTQSLQPKHGGITLPATGMNNYHAVVAEKDWGESKETVIRYEYLFGKPSEHSPSELAGAVKTELEIVPAPIPREHFRYLSDQPWGFQLRLHGRPAAGIPLNLETAHGTQLQALTDNQGYAAFRLPDDFPDVVPGKRDERGAEFSVSAVMQDGGITYETLLSATYRINPAHWQSSSMGWAVAGLGFIVGGLLGRQKDRGGKKS